ncbi:amino acid ABC transporter substrate-binding protein [Pseudaminobacter arsenicus]|uniref:Amino acid ABC transporter substrate-binding protein n=1 Tax=Borborobacter arsenicus TaxID=1851146 RepID=A0A432VAZ4_9HYPH|nr:ABC transporter substrate-binding protein [Pseudaminobacter arsenicus]RUM99330.1 amino acid ABC transporter substrate-binding protein [Pseudaminobacter arsenicus]
MKKTGILAGAAVALSMLISNAFADTIKIGVNQPLTGPVAASGNYVTNGARIAADQINEKGGVLGKQIELIIEDNKSNPTEAAAVAEKLIVRDEVSAIMGAWGSTMTLAVMPKLEEYGIPMVVETSSSGKITTSGNPWIFRTAPTSDMLADSFGPFVEKFGMKKAAFLAVNNDWGHSNTDAYSNMLAKHGVPTVLKESMDANAVDLSAQLAKIKASDADVLLVTTEIEQLTLIFKQAFSLRLPQKIIATTTSSTPDQAIEHAGSAADNAYFTVLFAPWFPDMAPNPEVAKFFAEEWERRDFEFAGRIEGQRGYDAILSIAAAVEKAGTAEPEAIRKALWEVEVKGVNSNIKFLKQGPEGAESGQNTANIFVVQVKGGKVVRPDFASQ